MVVAGLAAAFLGGVFDKDDGGIATETAIVAKPVPVTQTPAAAPEPEPELAAQPLRPAFDVVRAEVDGTTLVAGRGAPKTAITILMDEAELIVAKTDAAGKFAIFTTISPSEAPRVLQLVQRRDDGDLYSDATVILAPTPMPEAVDEPAEGQEEDTSVIVSAKAAPEPVAPTVLLQTKDGVSVMQPQENLSAAPEIMSSVALDAISYSESGEVQLSGRGGEDRFVRVYLDNSPVTTSRIEDGGNWQMQLPSVDSGVYTLRVDEVDEEGTVVSRLETPFKREDQTVLEASADTGSAARVVTVQPGSTLWAIAAERYGSGIMYVRVFEANKDRIRDPDLIFPGQVFDIPE